MSVPQRLIKYFSYFYFYFSISFLISIQCFCLDITQKDSPSSLGWAMGIQGLSPRISWSLQKFIMTMKNLLAVLNCNNHVGKGCDAPMSVKSMAYCEEKFLSPAWQMLSELQRPFGKLLIQSERQTGFNSHLGEHCHCQGSCRGDEGQQSLSRLCALLP